MLKMKNIAMIALAATMVTGTVPTMVSAAEVGDVIHDEEYGDGTVTSVEITTDENGDEKRIEYVKYDDGTKATIETTTEVVTESEATYVGYFYAAKGQPMVFQDESGKKFKKVTVENNKYKLNGKKLIIYCQKEGDVTYTANGITKTFHLYIGGNGADKKVNRSEYELPKKTVRASDGKYYNNWIDVVRSEIKSDSSSNYINIEINKKTLKWYKKYNRNVVAGMSLANVEKKYPSWQDIGGWGKSECCWVALYYDKKSGCVMQKGLVLDKKEKVKGLVYYASNPLDDDCVVTLATY